VLLSRVQWVPLEIKRDRQDFRPLRVAFLTNVLTARSSRVIRFLFLVLYSTRPAQSFFSFVLFILLGVSILPWPQWFISLSQTWVIFQFIFLVCVKLTYFSAFPLCCADTWAIELVKRLHDSPTPTLQSHVFSVRIFFVCEKISLLLWLHLPFFKWIYSIFVFGARKLCVRETDFVFFGGRHTPQGKTVLVAQ
jgi:hypothetical protein